MSPMYRFLSGVTEEKNPSEIIRKRDNGCVP